MRTLCDSVSCFCLPGLSIRIERYQKKTDDVAQLGECLPRMQKKKKKQKKKKNLFLAPEQPPEPLSRVSLHRWKTEAGNTGIYPSSTS